MLKYEKSALFHTILGDRARYAVAGLSFCVERNEVEWSWMSVASVQDL